MKRMVRRFRLGITWIGLGLYSAFETLRRHTISKRPRVNFLPADASDHSRFSGFSRLLMANHVRQFNPSSCSVASAVTVINAVREHLDPDHAKQRISQSELLDTIRTIHWRERVSSRGHNGQRGLPLDIFGKAVEACLDAYRIPFHEIDVVAFHKKDRNLSLKMDLLSERLIRFAEGRQSVIVAHFNQGAFVPGLHLPHISPIGAFDLQTQHVLILDVDPAQKAPYWTPFPVFVEGLASDFGGWLKRYGYAGGGYVWVDIEAPAASCEVLSLANPRLFDRC